MHSNDKSHDRIRVVVLTGLSGAGKTVALRAFEDLGFYCVDNLPTTLLPSLYRALTDAGRAHLRRLSAPEADQAEPFRAQHASYALRQLEKGARIRANGEPTPIHALLALQGRPTSGK